MLEPRSVAVVGASVREGSVGNQSVVELVEGGFEGRIVPVNPKYDAVLGLPAVASLADVDEPVDLAILAVSNALLEEQLRAAAEIGAGSAVIFASGYEDPREDAPPLTERLAAIAREAGMAVCGGNCMGFANLERRVRALGFYEPKDAPVGGITFLSHSGSAFSAMIHNDRLLGLNLAVSAGQEFVTTVADYLHYALSLESTRVVGLFIETIRDPEGFRSGLELANERDVPVVALKVGRETFTRELVAAHSGALAGEDGAYEALFDAYGVSRVESLDEMADALALFEAGRRAGPGGLASVHDSGGERALLVDAAAAVGVPFAKISPATTERLASLLDPGLPAVNPLDFWGTGKDAHEIVTGCVRALLEDEAVAALAFSVDLTTEEHDALGYVAMARETFPETDKPFAMLSNFAAGIDRNDARALHDDGITVLEGTFTGLTAFKHLFAARDHRALEPVAGSSPMDDAVRDRWKARLRSGDDLDELDGLELLAAYGLPVARAERASTLEDALVVAERIGYPVAVKTAEPNIQHKSDVDGVKLSLTDTPAVESAYEDVAERLGPNVLVAEMAPPGVELHLGIVRDLQFGPLVLVAAGGILVEVLRDRRLALPPLDETRARMLIDRLQIRTLLDGVRGQLPADLGSLVDAVVALSCLAHELGDHLEALDVNPVICSPNGCVAVDALVIPRRR
jgi:acetate---CoA ligase (ADP-forming)